jgi:hypothetical protein
MSAAELKTKDQAPEEAGTAPSVVGYVDAIVDGRVYGWAYDRTRPGARIAVRVEHEGDLLAAFIADRAREDLVAGGVGDGRHAFEAELPQGVAAGPLRVLAVAPETGICVELPLRGSPGAVAAPAGTAPEDLRDAVRAVAHAQRVLHRHVQSLAKSVDELSQGGTPAAGLSGADQAPDDLAGRVAALEAAVLRIDGLIEATSAKLKVTGPVQSDRLARFYAIGAALLSVIAVAAVFLR